MGEGAAAPQLLTGVETTVMSSSPRYFGKASDQIYGKKPQDVSRDLISQLKSGMSGLNHLKPNNENAALNAQIAMESLAKIRAEHQQPIPPDHETRSINSGMTYNQSAVGEMNTNELNKLLEKNDERI